MTSPKRWAALCKRQGLSDSAKTAYPDIYKRYREPHRHYHNLIHIQRCLHEVDKIKGRLIKPDEVEMALWFHDIMYRPTAEDNEELSARHAVYTLARFNAGYALRARVKDLILATRHQKFPKKRDKDARYLVDIDFSIMGAPESLFIEVESQIRQEYSIYSDEQFRKGRIKFLESTLSRPQIFCTDYYLKKCESQARINIQNALKRWRAG